MSNTPDTDMIRLIRLTGRRETEIEAAREQNTADWERIQLAVKEHNRFINMGEKHTRQKAVQEIEGLHRR